VGAHPDDVEILCGGTLARYAGAGCEVIVATATAGDRGSADMTMEQTAGVRRAEAGRAAEVIGAEYRCLEFVDGSVDGSSLEARERVVDLVRKTAPDLVFTHSPVDYHADHMATSKLVVEATFLASVPLLSTGVPATDKIVPVYYMDTLAGIGFEPEQYVDITEVFDIKREMLARHESQITWMWEHDQLDFVDFMTTVSKFRGFQCGAPYAEAFRPAHAWLREHAVRLLP